MRPGVQSPVLTVSSGRRLRPQSEGMGSGFGVQMATQGGRLPGGPWWDWGEILTFDRLREPLPWRLPRTWETNRVTVPLRWHQGWFALAQGLARGGSQMSPICSSLCQCHPWCVHPESCDQHAVYLWGPTGSHDLVSLDAK